MQRPNFIPDPNLDNREFGQRISENQLRNLLRGIRDNVYPGPPGGGPAWGCLAGIGGLFLLLLLITALVLSSFISQLTSASSQSNNQGGSTTIYYPYTQPATDTPVPTDTPAPTDTPLPQFLPSGDVPETDVESYVCYLAGISCNSPKTVVAFNAYPQQVHTDHVNQDVCMVLDFNIQPVDNQGTIWGTVALYSFDRSKQSWSQIDVGTYTRVRFSSDSDGATWCQKYVAYSDQNGNPVWSK